MLQADAKLALSMHEPQLSIVQGSLFGLSRGHAMDMCYVGGNIMVE